MSRICFRQLFFEECSHGNCDDVSKNIHKVGVMVAAGNSSDYELMAVGSAKIGWKLIGCRAYSKSPGAVLFERAVILSSDSFAVFT